MCSAVTVNLKISSNFFIQILMQDEFKIVKSLPEALALFVGVVLCFGQTPLDPVTYMKSSTNGPSNTATSFNHQRTWKREPSKACH